MDALRGNYRSGSLLGQWNWRECAVQDSTRPPTRFRVLYAALDRSFCWKQTQTSAATRHQQPSRKNLAASCGAQAPVPLIQRVSGLRCEAPIRNPSTCHTSTYLRSLSLHSSAMYRDPWTANLSVIRKVRRIDVYRTASPILF